MALNLAEFNIKVVFSGTICLSPQTKGIRQDNGIGLHQNLCVNLQFHDSPPNSSRSRPHTRTVRPIASPSRRSPAFPPSYRAGNVSSLAGL
jgi:hypothetical protein